MNNERLGDILIKRRILTPDQLGDALTAQVTNGGRLGTNLIELGLIGLDQLSLVLAELHGVQAASREAFDQVSSATLGALDRQTCATHRVLPLHLGGGLIHLAMIDPHDFSAIETVGDRLDVTVQSYVTPQLRMFHYLEHHYQIPRPKRYLRVPEGKIDHRRRHYLAPTVRPAPRPQPAESPAQIAAKRAPEQRMTTGPAHPAVAPLATPSDAEIELVFLDEVKAVPPAAEAMDIDIDISFDDFDSNTPAPPEDLEGVIERLGDARTRDEVVRLLSRPVIAKDSLNVVFLPRGELAVAMGACGGDKEVDAAEIRALVVPLSDGSLLAQAHETGRVYCGTADGDSIQVMIATYLRVDPPHTVCVAPVCIGTRTVNLMVVQSRDELPPSAEADIARLATAGSRAYRNLIANLKAK